MANVAVYNMEGKEVGTTRSFLSDTGAGGRRGSFAGGSKERNPRETPGPRLRSHAQKIQRQGRDPLPAARQEPERRHPEKAPGLETD